MPPISLLKLLTGVAKYGIIHGRQAMTAHSQLNRLKNYFNFAESKREAEENQGGTTLRGVGATENHVHRVIHTKRRTENKNTSKEEYEGDA